MHEKFEAYGNFSLVPKMDLNSKGFYLSLNHIGQKTNKDKDIADEKEKYKTKGRGKGKSN